MSFREWRDVAVLSLGLLTAVAGPAAAQAADPIPAFASPVRPDVDAGIAAGERALAPAPREARTPASALPAQLFSGSGGQGVGIGALGMITRASWRTDGFDELIDSRTGWGAGLWFGGNKDGVVGATGEIIYVTRKVDQLGLELETRSVEIPILLRINIGSRSRAGFTVYAVGGPVVTWHLQQTLDGVDVGDDYRNGDLGVMAGLGFEVFHIGIEGRGNWGLRSVSIDGAFDETKTYQFELVGKIRFN